MSAGYLFHDVAPARPTIVLSVPAILARCVAITAAAGAVALAGGFALLRVLQELVVR